PGRDRGRAQGRAARGPLVPGRPARLAQQPGDRRGDDPAPPLRRRAGQQPVPVRAQGGPGVRAARRPRPAPPPPRPLLGHRPGLRRRPARLGRRRHLRPQRRLQPHHRPDHPPHRRRHRRRARRPVPRPGADRAPDRGLLRQRLPPGPRRPQRRRRPLVHRRSPGGRRHRRGTRALTRKENGMTLSRSLLPPAALLAVALAGSAGPPDPELDGVRQVGQEFANAFARGDSAAVAALWTARGEYEDDRGTLVHGRDEIAKLYEAYFKEHPGGRLEIRPASVRLLARDAAVEEGVLRSVRPGAELPTSSLYRVFLVREEGRWRIAQVREWDSSRDRLEDLEWLLGTWKASAKDQDVTLTVTRHPK